MKIVTTAMQLHANNEIKVKAAQIEQQLATLSVSDATITIDKEVKAVPPGPPTNN